MKEDDENWGDDFNIVAVIIVVAVLVGVIPVMILIWPFFVLLAALGLVFGIPFVIICFLINGIALFSSMNNNDDSTNSPTRK